MLKKIIIFFFGPIFHFAHLSPLHGCRDMLDFTISEMYISFP